MNAQSYEGIEKYIAQGSPIDVQLENNIVNLITSTILLTMFGKDEPLYKEKDQNISELRKKQGNVMQNAMEEFCYMMQEIPPEMGADLTLQDVFRFNNSAELSTVSNQLPTKNSLTLQEIKALVRNDTEEGKLYHKIIEKLTENVQSFSIDDLWHKIKEAFPNIPNASNISSKEGVAKYIKRSKALRVSCSFLEKPGRGVSIDDHNAMKQMKWLFGQDNILSSRLEFMEEREEKMYAVDTVLVDLQEAYKPAFVAKLKNDTRQINSLIDQLPNGWQSFEQEQLNKISIKNILYTQEIHTALLRDSNDSKSLKAKKIRDLLGDINMQSGKKDISLKAYTKLVFSHFRKRINNKLAEQSRASEFPKLAKDMLSAMQGGKPACFVVNLGGAHWVAYTAYPIFKDGKLVKVISVQRNSMSSNYNSSLFRAVEEQLEGQGVEHEMVSLNIPQQASLNCGFASAMNVVDFVSYYYYKTKVKGQAFEFDEEDFNLWSFAFRIREQSNKRLNNLEEEALGYVDNILGSFDVRLECALKIIDDSNIENPVLRKASNTLNIPKSTASKEEIATFKVSLLTMYQHHQEAADFVKLFLKNVGLQYPKLSLVEKYEESSIGVVTDRPEFLRIPQARYELLKGIKEAQKTINSKHILAIKILELIHNLTFDWVYQCSSLNDAAFAEKLEGYQRILEEVQKYNVIDEEVLIPQRFSKEILGWFCEFLSQRIVNGDFKEEKEEKEEIYCILKDPEAHREELKQLKEIVEGIEGLERYKQTMKEAFQDAIKKGLIFKKLNRFKSAIAVIKGNAITEDTSLLLKKFHNQSSAGNRVRAAAETLKLFLSTDQLLENAVEEITNESPFWHIAQKILEKGVQMSELQIKKSIEIIKLMKSVAEEDDVEEGEAAGVDQDLKAHLNILKKFKEHAGDTLTPEQMEQLRNDVASDIIEVFAIDNKTTLAAKKASLDRKINILKYIYLNECEDNDIKTSLELLKELKAIDAASLLPKFVIQLNSYKHSIANNCLNGVDNQVLYTAAVDFVNICKPGVASPNPTLQTLLAAFGTVQEASLNDYTLEIYNKIKDDLSPNTPPQKIELYAKLIPILKGEPLTDASKGALYSFGLQGIYQNAQVDPKEASIAGKVINFQEITEDEFNIVKSRVAPNRSFVQNNLHHIQNVFMFGAVSTASCITAIYIANALQNHSANLAFTIYQESFFAMINAGTSHLAVILPILAGVVVGAVAVCFFKVEKEVITLNPNHDVVIKIVNYISNYTPAQGPQLQPQV